MPNFNCYDWTTNDFCGQLKLYRTLQGLKTSTAPLFMGSLQK